MSKVLFIGNLSRSVEEGELHTEFSKYGNVTSLTLKGTFGFVEYENTKDAEDALEHLNGKEFADTKIALQWGKPQNADKPKTSGFACYNCGKTGHRANECRSRPQNDSNSGYRRGGQGNQSDATCYNCGKTGHMARECDGPRDTQNRGYGSRPSGNTRGGQDNACYNCGEKGHRANECDQADSRDKGYKGYNSRPTQSRSRPDDGCYKCGEKGHWANECKGTERADTGYSTRPSNRGTDSGCYNCGESGHRARECDQPKKEGTNSYSRPSQARSGQKEGCFKCGKTGHWAKECTAAGN